MRLFFDQFGRFHERWVSPHFTRWLLLALVPVLIASAIAGIFLRDNDFHWHYAQGEKVLAGRTPGDGQSGGIPALYLLGRMMFDAALALLPYRFARVLVWTAAVGALIHSLRLWGRLLGWETSRQKALAVLAVWWVLPFIYRDLDDCGLQVLTLTLFSLGAAALIARRPSAAGVWMALAASYKTTPLLVLPYLLYKRLWREAAVMTAVLVLINGVLPIAFFGWPRTIAAHEAFAALALTSTSSADPSANGLDAPTQQNLSLKLTLVRFLQTFPPEHPLFLAAPGQKNSVQEPLVPVSQLEPHWAFFQFFDANPATVNLVIAAILLTLSLALAWAFRQPGSSIPGARLARELAIVAVLFTILSPMCWQQHFVTMLPLVLIVLGDGFCQPMGRWRRVLLLGVWCCLWLPQREIFGRDLTVVISSYKLPTLACLVLIFLALRRSRIVTASPDTPPALDRR